MKPYRVAVAGCGSMADEWVRYAIEREDAEIVALMDIKEENAKTMAERYKLEAGIFTDLKAAIAEAGANLVFDVTIPEAHSKIVTTALSFGCNVMGEKPMAASMEEAVRMVAEAEKSGKSYSVMQNRRYIKDIRTFRQIITSGLVGKIGYIGADFFVGPHFGGFRDLMDSPLLLDMAIHTFDQARFISGADAVSVYCHSFNPPGSWYKGDASAICIFEMSDGSVFCYRGSWCAEGLSTSWEASWRVTGSEGTAMWDGNSSPVCERVIHSPGFDSETVKVEVEPKWEGREWHFGCLDEMFKALSESRRAETDCRDNIKSMAMVYGALESAKKGQKVLIEI